LYWILLFGVPHVSIKYRARSPQGHFAIDYKTACEFFVKIRVGCVLIFKQKRLLARTFCDRLQNGARNFC